MVKVNGVEMTKKEFFAYIVAQKKKAEKQKKLKKSTK